MVNRCKRLLLSIRAQRSGSRPLPLGVSADGGDHEDYILNRLPMRFSLAPIIAQRASNIVVSMTKEMMTEQNTIQIACKEVDKTGEFVGLQRTQLGVNIQEGYVESSPALNAPLTRHRAWPLESG